MSIQSTVTHSERRLSRADRCDRCGAQAYIEATLTNGGQLLFCAHHGKEHTPALQGKVASLVDETWVLDMEEQAKTMSTHLS